MHTPSLQTSRASTVQPERSAERTGFQPAPEPIEGRRVSRDPALAVRARMTMLLFGACSALIAIGLHTWLNPRFLGPQAIVMVAIALAVAVYALRRFKGAYQPPRTATRKALEISGLLLVGSAALAIAGGAIVFLGVAHRQVTLQSSAKGLKGAIRKLDQAQSKMTSSQARLTKMQRQVGGSKARISAKAHGRPFTKLQQEQIANADRLQNQIAAHQAKVAKQQMELTNRGADLQTRLSAIERQLAQLLRTWVLGAGLTLLSGIMLGLVGFVPLCRSIFAAKDRQPAGTF